MRINSYFLFVIFDYIYEKHLKFNLLVFIDISMFSFVSYINPSYHERFWCHLSHIFQRGLRGAFIQGKKKGFVSQVLKFV